MAKFLVTPEMGPGVFRQGIGFFAPGSIVTLPDSASTKTEKPSIKYQPLDQEAHDMLVKAWPKQKGDIKPLEAYVPEQPKADERLTILELAKKHGLVLVSENSGGATTALVPPAEGGAAAK